METIINIFYIFLGLSCFALYRYLKKKWYKKNEDEFIEKLNKKESQ